MGVRIDHFKHVKPLPEIELFPDDPPVTNISINTPDEPLTHEKSLVYSVATADLTAEVTSYPYTVTFKSPKRTLTSAGYKHQAIYDIPYKYTQNTAANSSCLATDLSSNPHPETPPEVVRYTHSELNISPGELIYGMGEQFGSFVKNGQVFSRRSLCVFDLIPSVFRPDRQCMES